MKKARFGKRADPRLVSVLIWHKKSIGKFKIDTFGLQSTCFVFATGPFFSDFNKRRAHVAKTLTLVLNVQHTKFRGPLIRHVHHYCHALTHRQIEKQCSFYNLISWADPVRVFWDEWHTTPSEDKSTLVQVMDWCRQATSLSLINDAILCHNATVSW